MSQNLFWILFSICIVSVSTHNPIYISVIGEETTLQLAGKDATRYLRILKCGYGPLSSSCVMESSETETGLADSNSVPSRISQPALSSNLPQNGAQTLLVTTTSSLTTTQRAFLGTSVDNLSGDSHLFGPLDDSNQTIVCTGATPRAVLYAVYSLLESLGARFYLTGDVLPKPNNSLRLPSTIQFFDPVFKERGIQPFHDFPMGPDFWTLQFFKFTATQMTKMKMNKWGFHTYPFGSAGPEPLAWVGLSSQFDPTTGDILPEGGGAYTSSWYLTENFPRGNLPGSVSRATSDYCCGAGQTFPRDCFGSEAQSKPDQCWPITSEASASVLNDAAALLQGAFQWGKDTGGISACLGSEMPLTKPPNSNASTSELYTGMFGRAASAIPAADCFWLWTTEAVEDHSTGKGYPQSNPLWAALTEEIGIALAARDSVAPNLSIGSNGWCLGPGDNSTYFDKELSDPRFSLSSIDGSLGWNDVDPSFANVTAHPSTIIPWLEDDLGLAGGELWVERTLAHASDAARFNASGLLGILWRTFETTPQLSALSAAAWQSPSSPPLTAQAIYRDFCTSNFGAATSENCTSLFLSLDGALPGAATFDASRSRLPRGGQLCCGGPVSPQGQEGAVRVIDTTEWELWSSIVSMEGGAANTERAERWVGLMQYHAALAEACLAGQALEAAAARVVNESTAREIGFPALAAMTWAWEAMMTSLLEITTTPGQLGMIAAHEGMNWPSNFYAAAGPILPFLTSCDSVEKAPCYWDNYTTFGRVLPYTVTLDSSLNSREWCASACLENSYVYSGVEFGVACFCGNSLPNASFLIPSDQCSAIPCSADPTEGCGDADKISVFPSSCPQAQGVPPGLLPGKAYVGSPRMWLSAPRSTVGSNEVGILVEVVVLSSQQPSNVTAVWWLVPSNGAGNVTTPLLSEEGQGRGIWAATLPIPSDTSVSIEYIVLAKWIDSTQLTVPVEGAQSVIIL